MGISRIHLNWPARVRVGNTYTLPYTTPAECTPASRKHCGLWPTEQNISLVPAYQISSTWNALIVHVQHAFGLLPNHVSVNTTGLIEPADLKKLEFLFTDPCKTERQSHHSCMDDRIAPWKKQQRCTRREKGELPVPGDVQFLPVSAGLYTLVLNLHTVPSLMLNPRGGEPKGLRIWVQTCVSRPIWHDWHNLHLSNRSWIF